MKNKDTFSQMWNNRGIKDSYPKVNNIRLESDTVDWKSDWISLYLGKYHGGLGTRIRQHVVISTPQTTGALKLGRNPLEFTEWKFKLSTISFGKKISSKIFLSVAEEVLRNELNPIVGDEG